MWRDPDDQIQVARLPSSCTASALPTQPDPLPIHDTGRDVDVESACAVRSADGETALGSAVCLLNGDLGFDLLIGARYRAPIGPAAAAEYAAEQVVEIDVLSDVGVPSASWRPPRSSPS